VFDMPGVQYDWLLFFGIRGVWFSLRDVI